MTTREYYDRHEQRIGTLDEVYIPVYESDGKGGLERKDGQIGIVVGFHDEDDMVLVEIPGETKFVRASYAGFAPSDLTCVHLFSTDEERLSTVRMKIAERERASLGGLLFTLTQQLFSYASEYPSRKASVEPFLEAARTFALAQVDFFRALPEDVQWRMAPLPSCRWSSVANNILSIHLLPSLHRFPQATDDPSEGEEIDRTETRQ